MKIHSLGVLLDTGLLLDKEMAVVARGNFFCQLWLVRHLWSFLSRKDFANMVYALVTYTLEYLMCSVWRCPWKLSLSYSWYRILWPECWLEWVIGTISLQSCSMYSGFCFWAHFKVVLIFKDLYDLWPVYLKDCLLPYKLHCSHLQRLSFRCLHHLRTSWVCSRNFGTHSPGRFIALPLLLSSIVSTGEDVFVLFDIGLLCGCIMCVSLSMLYWII